MYFPKPASQKPGASLGLTNHCWVAVSWEDINAGAPGYSGKNILRCLCFLLVIICPNIPDLRGFHVPVELYMAAQPFPPSSLLLSFLFTVTTFSNLKVLLLLSQTVLQNSPGWIKLTNVLSSQYFIQQQVSSSCKFHWQTSSQTFSKTSIFKISFKEKKGVFLLFLKQPMMNGLSKPSDRLRSSQLQGWCVSSYEVCDYNPFKGQ